MICCDDETINYVPAEKITNYLIDNYTKNNNKFELINAGLWKAFSEREAAVKYLLNEKGRVELFDEAKIYLDNNYFRITALFKYSDYQLENNFLKNSYSDVNEEKSHKRRRVKSEDKFLPKLPYDVIDSIFKLARREYGISETISRAIKSEKNLGDGLIRSIENNDKELVEKFLSKLDSPKSLRSLTQALEISNKTFGKELDISKAINLEVGKQFDKIAKNYLSFR